MTQVLSSIFEKMTFLVVLHVTGVPFEVFKSRNYTKKIRGNQNSKIYERSAELTIIFLYDNASDMTE